VDNLTNRLRGAEAVAVAIEVSGGSPAENEVRQRLEQVPGVSRVLHREARDVRADLARAVVNAGWSLSELRPVGLSLEDIFLQLTAAEAADANGSGVKRGDK
jgi:ABC-2 type transport system ATP-binding protein